ncbi:MAG TPA: cysteine desulfurase family protein [Planctomycetota bacterium]
MRVYLDHNSTSPLRPEVRERWLAVSGERLGNASSLHAPGRRARALVDDARARVAAALGVHEEEIFFTSGATEANNLALLGSLRAAGTAPGLVLPRTEHSSVLEPARAWAEAGHAVVHVPCDEHGELEPAKLRAAVASTPVGLLSLSAANNETGTAPDLARLVAALPEPRPRVHVDAVQALGRLPVRLAEWGADLATFSAHKLGGPPGVGILWRRRGLALAPLCFGGGQELGLRPGTENVPAVAAAALAVELAVRAQPEEAPRLLALARGLWDELAAAVPGARLVGPPLASRRLPNTLCVLLPGTDGKVLVTRLDLAGLEVSAGSACASGSIEPSHVLLALGLARDAARSAVRLSLGWNTTHADCKRAAAIFHDEFAALRAT